MSGLPASPRPSRARFLFFACFIVGMAYGTSYQQFRHLDLASGGVSDGLIYMAMAHGHGENIVNEVYRDRFVTPALAGALNPLISRLVHDPQEVDKLCFYLVNFFFMALASGFFFYYLTALGFRTELALLGVALFLGNRIAILCTGAPLADAVYFCAIAVIACLAVRGQVGWLAALCPLLILSKETIIPFLLLPLLDKRFRTLRYVLALVAAGVVLIVARRLAALHWAGSPAESVTLLDIIVQQIHHLGYCLRRALAPSGIHDFLNCFSLMLVLAIFGYLHNRRRPTCRIPPFILLSLPLAIGYALFNGNFGRMFFAAFAVVIPYALVGIEAYLVGGEQSGASAASAEGNKPA